MLQTVCIAFMRSMVVTLRSSQREGDNHELRSYSTNVVMPAQRHAEALGTLKHAQLTVPYLTTYTMILR